MVSSTSSPVSQEIRTPVIVGRDVLGSDVGSHRNDGYMLINSPDIHRRRDAVDMGHDDVHENQVKSLGVLVYLIRCLLAIFLRMPSALSLGRRGTREPTASSTEHSI